MYKLSFDLEPLTYMVHFQKDDANATIRASELKPMFDRYLTEVINHNNLKKRDYPILESYSDDEASDESDYLHFDYQVRVEINAEKQENIIIDPFDRNVEFFFKDNRANISKFKKVKTYPKIIFLTRHLRLAKLFQDYFEFFVAITFFGFRKGKGYGQFRVKKGQIIEGKETDRKKLIEGAYKNIGIDPIIFDIPHNKNREDSVIQFINERNRVLKSVFLEKFVNEKHFKHNWDKELISSRIQGLDDSQVTPENTRFLRLLFGLSGQYGTYNKIENDKIDRFENPVKYFISYSDGANPQKYLHVVIEKQKIKELLETVGNSEFTFSRVEKQNGNIITCQNPKPFSIKTVSLQNNELELDCHLDNELDLDCLLEKITKQLKILPFPNQYIQNAAKNRNQSNNRNQGRKNRTWNRR